MDRTLIIVTGPDRDAFLKGLLTRDVPDEGLGYAALLTPQGKYLADFLTLRRPDAIWLDVHPDLAAGLVQRLTMYKLRADVGLSTEAVVVERGLGAPPEGGALRDPRPGMGWRRYHPVRAGGPAPAPAEDGTDWDAVRVEHLIPETGVELIPNESFVLEMGFERLGGVDFRKGCYVGQEIVARMKHKTELRKGLARVRLSGPAAPGTPILSADGRPAGTLHTVSGDRALAYLRFDRAEGEMTAGEATAVRDA
ncbi:folate-binding protein YgfZ [Jannaschia sp. Os4]|uniref:CAF17-like 4Fe-4S cluster assembly/insertion protein YgfZ n=1 Tax=Jannaschia sp. Os4 TaxID=2807617 RepID=UPI00193A3205|nr:folate-binding protein YgfZ [Jannaschia sp. Os4]MBM2574768.1 folate-binding protein YgfZ [Jannaschia sp. Os4]